MGDPDGGHGRWARAHKALPGAARKQAGAETVATVALHLGGRDLDQGLRGVDAAEDVARAPPGRLRRLVRPLRLGRTDEGQHRTRSG